MIKNRGDINNSRSRKEVSSPVASQDNDVVVLETDHISRCRTGNGALFSSTKCPGGPGMSHSCELPFGFLWTPLSPMEDDNNNNNSNKEEEEIDTASFPSSSTMITCEGQTFPAVLCITCLAYLNLYAEFNSDTGFWTCPLCGAKNVAPLVSLRTAGTLASQLLAQPIVEFRQQLIVNPEQLKTPDTCSIILVVDQNLPAAEAQAVGSTMQTILSELAMDKSCGIRLGLITFGRQVSVYQLGITGLASADVFRHPDAFSEHHIQSRHYLQTIRPGDDLECIWRCLSAVYGITMQDENVEQNKPSRLDRLRQRKEARLRRQEGGGSVDSPPLGIEHSNTHSATVLAKSPWTEARNKAAALQTKRCTAEAIQCAIDLATIDTDDSKSSRTSRILLFTNGCPNYGEGSVVVDDKHQQAKPKDRTKPSPDIVDPVNLAQTVQYFKMVAKSAGELGVAMDVLCTGASELALPSYQALVEPSAGYVLPHATFTTEHLKWNLDFILKQTHVAGLHFDAPDPGSELPLRDDVWLDGCIVDVRMSSFLTPTHLIGPGVILDHGKCLLANERAAFAVGASLAAKHGIPTNHLPAVDMLETTMTRINMGRADPISTFSVMAQVNEFFQREQHAFFQCVVRYLDRSGKYLVTRIATHRLSVAKQSGEWLDAVDDDVVPVLLAKEAVYRSVFGREMRESDETETPDAYRLEDLAYDAQRDLDATIHKISRAFRLLSLELGTTRNGMDLTEEGGVKAAGSSVDFAFPPELADALRRLYHFRRGPLLSPGPMQSMDDRAEIRSLFLRLPLEDCLSMMALSLWSTGSLNQAPVSDMLQLRPVPPETLALWDYSILAGDNFYSMFVWSGRSAVGPEFDEIRKKMTRFLLERSQMRFPMPSLYVLAENDSMSRRFTAVLAPSHGDPVEQQLANFPALGTLTPQELSELQSKFKFYDPSTDASFRIWFWSVASATSSSREEGMSLCE